ncbi:MAG: orotate phosphoribosyltransferase [bacterium]
MSQEKTLEVFRKANAMLVGHFLLTSGKHSNIYLEKFLVLQHPTYTAELCKEFVNHFKAKKIQVVIGAAVGGIILAYETARQLKVRGIFMEREEGKLTLRRGFSIEKGERVLVVEDIVTTGGSVVELIAQVKAAGGNVVGVGALINRSGGEVDFGVEDTQFLAKVDVMAYEEKNCPFCKKEMPLTKRGSRNLEKKK